MPFVDAPTRAILEADISTEAVEASIQAAMMNYVQRFGPIRHVWVHPKDVPAELLVIDKIMLERKGGCPRHKVWVM